MGVAGIVLRHNRSLQWKTYGALAGALLLLSNAMTLNAIVEERSHK